MSMRDEPEMEDDFRSVLWSALILFFLKRRYLPSNSIYVIARKVNLLLLITFLEGYHLFSQAIAGTESP